MTQLKNPIRGLEDIQRVFHQLNAQERQDRHTQWLRDHKSNKNPKPPKGDKKEVI